MKNANELYCTILNEWTRGEGLNFKRHNIQKDDIPLMVNYYQRFIKPEIANDLILCIIYEILETK